MRNLKLDQLPDLRGCSVSVVEGGEAPAILAKVFLQVVSTVFGWLAKYRGVGWGALQASRRADRRPMLGTVELKNLYETITTNVPRQLQFAFAS